MTTAAIAVAHLKQNLFETLIVTRVVKFVRDNRAKFAVAWFDSPQIGL